MNVLKKVCGAAVGVIALGFGLTACGSTPSVAKVNGTVITRAELFSELNAIAADPTYVSSYSQEGITVKGKAKGTFTTAFVDQIIDQRISVIVIEQADKKLKLDITSGDLALAKTDLIGTLGGTKTFDAFPAEYRTYLINSTAEFTALEAYLAKVTISQATVETYYKAHPAVLANVCASVIVVATKAKADTIETSLSKGASFATLAKDDSEDSSTASNGGVVGCSIPEAFGEVYGTGVASVVQTLASGKVSAPVEVSVSASTSAYVITKVTSRTPLTETQAVPVILGLELNSSANALTSYEGKQIKASKISVNPSYGRYTVKSGAVDVLAPKQPPAADLVNPTTTTTTTVPATTTTTALPATTTTTAPKTTTTTAKPATTTTAKPATTTTAKPATTTTAKPATTTTAKPATTTTAKPATTTTAKASGST